MRKFLFCAAFLLSVFSAFANVRLPAIFGDGMVLQRSQSIPVWGWADNNETVTVTFNKQTKTIKAGTDGKWRVDLSPEKAGGPFVLTVKGKNTISLKEVLVGEVWICSGQSNMEWTVRNSNNSEAEIKAANYPDIRHYKVPLTVAGTPLEDLKSTGSWKAATPDNAGDFTAVGYFFARDLYKQLNIPIGLINTTWGGTDVETWTSREAFETSDEFKDMIKTLPKINLEELGKQKKEETSKRVKLLQGGLPANSEVSKWKGVAFNDSKWAKMQLPGLWEQKDLSEFDGVVWLRKEITLTAGDAGKEGVLELGPIDDSDVSYVNGVKVGNTVAKYNEKRVYKIPGGVLKPGKNSIAVRVEDTGGGGGIYGDAADLKFTVSGKSQSLAGDWTYRVEAVSEASASVGPNTYPTLLFNAMVNPLIPYAFKGALWYQGESNSARAYQYRKAFPLMITDWRKRWGQGDFPFYFVQLASYNAGGGNSQKGSTWAELREAQTLTLKLPNTGMAVTTDIGEENDIHPKNKQDVGKRLAAVALNKLYARNNIYSGPVYKTLKVEGNNAIVDFDETGTGLITQGEELLGFEIAGSDKKFYPAKAVISGNTVVLTASEVSRPIAVRFAWSDYAGTANLYNKEGFPAIPFRTDEWEGITGNSKYRQ